MGTSQHDQDAARYGRRQVFVRVGAGAAGAVAAGVGTARAADVEADAQVGRADRFGRIFNLPPFAAPSPQLRDALLAIGRPGGPLDAKDALERGPIDLIVDPALSAGNPNNPDHTAGTTFFGQFIDHDLTFDTTSQLGRPTPPRTAPNARTPAFDLDSVYGGGPTVSPHLYDPADRAKLLVGHGGLFEDLPRGANQTAILADARNDEHIILAGLHAAFLLFHNRAVDHVRRRGAEHPAAAFVAARLLTAWHYQWMVVNEFLPLIVGRPLVDSILARGRRFFRPAGEAFMPVEFQGAAFRFGHSVIRPSYRANMRGDNGGPFFGFIFDPAEEGKADPGDLRGGVRAPRRFVGWQTFFDFGDGEVRPNKLIDTKLSTPLFNLPTSAIAQPGGPTSLPQRTLLRHLTWELPSGQRIARFIGAPVLDRRDLAELSGFGLNLDRETPLFHYILKEAEVMEAGRRLGPVGGRIVAEVIIGLLQLDRTSYLARSPGWRPTLPARGGAGTFRMVDFLTFAGVDPASRGQ
jgi:hypothetical protein